MATKRRLAVGLVFGIIAVLAGLWSLGNSVSHIKSAEADVKVSCNDLKKSVVNVHNAIQDLPNGVEKQNELIKFSADLNNYNIQCSKTTGTLSL